MIHASLQTLELLAAINPQIQEGIRASSTDAEEEDAAAGVGVSVHAGGAAVTAHDIAAASGRPGAQRHVDHANIHATAEHTDARTKGQEASSRPENTHKIQTMTQPSGDQVSCQIVSPSVFGHPGFMMQQARKGGVPDAWRVLARCATDPEVPISGSFKISRVLDREQTLRAGAELRVHVEQRRGQEQGVDGSRNASCDLHARGAPGSVASNVGRLDNISELNSRNASRESNPGVIDKKAHEGDAIKAMVRVHGSMYTYVCA
jgi:hypothetical protein